MPPPLLDPFFWPTIPRMGRYNTVEREGGGDLGQKFLLKTGHFFPSTASLPLKNPSGRVRGGIQQGGGTIQQGGGHTMRKNDVFNPKTTLNTQGGIGFAGKTRVRLCEFLAVSKDDPCWNLRTNPFTSLSQHNNSRCDLVSHNHVSAGRSAKISYPFLS